LVQGFINQRSDFHQTSIKKFLKKFLNSGNLVNLRSTKHNFEVINLLKKINDREEEHYNIKSKFSIIMKSKSTSLKQWLAVIIILTSATATHAQSLHHDFTETGTGTITNLQNMTVLGNGDRYVVEVTDDGFSVSKYNDDLHLVWRTPYAPAGYSGPDYVPVAAAYNAGAIFVLCNVYTGDGNVVKFNATDGLQIDENGWGGGFIHRSKGIVADPRGTGVIVTFMTRYTDPEYFGHRQHRMNTIKYDGDLNEVWPRRVGQSLGVLEIGVSQNPTPTPRAITADPDGNIYITGVLDVAGGSATPPYRTSAASAFTLKYNSDGVLQWMPPMPPEPSITNFGYNNDYDATGTYTVYQSAPLHLVDGPLPTGMTVLTKRNLDGTTWPPQRRPSRLRDLRVPDDGTAVHPNVLAVDKSTSSAYIAYDEVPASSVTLEKYDETGAMLWDQHISIGASTSVESVVLDNFGNVVVGVNNDVLGSYGIFVFGRNGNFIDKIEVADKLLKQLLVDDHNHIHTIGTISGSTTSYFVSRFSYDLSRGYSSMPEVVKGIEKFEVDLFAFDLGECWTGPFINWDCLRPPYCVNPKEVKASLLFEDKTVWESTFSKPINTTFPESKDFRTFSLKVNDGKMFQQVLLVDDKLVKNGVTQLSFKTNSIDESVDLNITTDGAQIPVTISLLNSQGKVLWKEQFTAPFQKQLSERFNEPVASISINGPEDKISFSYYPNPSNGAFTVMVDHVNLPAELSVYDMQGFRIHQQIVKESKVPINMSIQKPGLYVLSLKNGSDEIKELIQIK
jgi:hypothetical protein